MRIRWLGTFLLGVIIPCTLVLANSHVKHTSPYLSHTLLQLLQKSHSSANMGILVSDVKTGKTIFSYQANLLFNPASVQKLFTAIAALNYLGSTYQFYTQLWTNGTIEKNTLKGDLIIKFSGDPQFSHQDLNHLIGELKTLGIDRIKGKIYIDQTDYTFLSYPPGWLWDDLSYGYAAPMGAVIIDQNKFLLHLSPVTVKKPPVLQPNLPSGVVSFINHAKTIPNADRTCPLTLYSDMSNQYWVLGCVNKAWGLQHVILALRNPLLYAKRLIPEALRDNHIDYTGEITLTQVTAQDHLLIQHESIPLTQLVKKMLKTSDNLITDSLLNKMGQLYFKTSGTWKNGLLAMQKILAPSAINFKKIRLNDGAGLSRYNLVSPFYVVQLLRFAYRTPNIRAPLLQALPIGGKDGTLMYRMPNLAARQCVHAKTGSMAGISALAGYVTTRKHQVLAFSILINGFVGKNRPYAHLEDQICEILAQSR